MAVQGSGDRVFADNYPALNNRLYAVEALLNAPIGGNIYYVDSANGNDARSGLSPDTALLSISSALSKLENAKDNDSGFVYDNVIACMPGHTETVSAASSISGNTVTGVHVSVEGTRILGLGEGSNRAKINFTTANTADINIEADGCVFENIDFTASVASLAAPIDINSGGIRCAFINTRAYLGGAVAVPTTWIADAIGDVVMDRTVWSNAQTYDLGIAKMLKPGENYTPGLALDFTSATANTAAAHETHVVTRLCEGKYVFRCLTDLTSGGSATLTLGWADDPDGLIGSTAFDDLNADDLWIGTTPNAGSPDAANIPIRFSSNGRDLGYTVGTAALTGGTAEDWVIWEQGEGGAFILPGALGTFA